MAEYTEFTWKGRCGPFELALSEHTFRPSSLSLLLSEAMEVEQGETVLDMGCGSGVLSIVAAKLGAGRVFGVDVAPDTEDVAGRNAQQQGVGDVTTFYTGDLYEPLPDDLKADLIIGDVSGIPDPVARVSGWFPSGRGGGARGSELPVRMLQGARERLRPGGRVLLPTGTLQDEEAVLSTAKRLFGSLTERLEKRYPLPGAIAESPELLALMRDKVIDLSRRGSRLFWHARVWECVLQPAAAEST